MNKGQFICKIYGYEPERKQQSTVWVFEDKPNPTKVFRGGSPSKQMVVCFFDKTGHVANVSLEHRTTVNSEWYTIIAMPKVFAEIRNSKNEQENTNHWQCLLSHIGSKQRLFGRSKCHHSTYSPDLAPNVFFLFAHFKIILRGQRFSPNTNFC